MNPPQTLRTKRVGLGQGGKGDERERMRRRIKGEDGMFSVSGSSVHFRRSFLLNREPRQGFEMPEVYCSLCLLPELQTQIILQM